MALVNVAVGSNTLKVGLPTELDIKRLLCALLAGDINNLMKGPLICINIAIEDLLGQLPSNALAGALRDLQGEIGNLLEASGINDTLGRLNSATSQLESLFGLGGICPVPFTLPRIGNILGDMVAAYSAGARNIIQDIANLEQALSNICLGTGGIGANWNNMVDGSLKRLKQDIDTFGGSQIPENVIGQYVAQFNQSKTAISGIIDRMNGGSGEDATRVAAAAGLAFQLNGLYDRIGSYPVSDGNIVYDNVFKMFLDPDVYEALIGMQGGSSLITEDQPVFDNCGRVISTRTVVLQGDIATQPFDATLDASVVPIPAPALGDFKIREESGEFKVNLLSGTNPVITLIKGRSYNIALETETIGVNIVDPATDTFYNEGLVHEDGSQGEYAQNKKVGFLTWNIPLDAPNELKYADVAGTQTNKIVLQNVSVAGIPINPDGNATNSFGKIAVIGKTDIQANIPGDTLRFAPGSNISFETDPTNNILTISSTGGSGSAIVAKDEGNTLTSTLTSLNFVGSGVTATSAGNDVTVTITGGGSGSAITVKEEGTTLTSALTSLNFVGSLITATTVGNDVTITAQTPPAANSFANIQAGTTVVSADSPTDTLTFAAGNGINIIANATTDTITIVNTLSSVSFPDQSGKSGYVLGTDGFNVLWTLPVPGPTGPTGPAGPQGQQGIQGQQGDQGIQGAQGIQGPAGEQGVSVNLLGTKATIGDLPATGNPGDGWIVTTGDGGTHLDGSLWIWNTVTSTWDDVGRIVGPIGPQGTQGIQGPEGIQGPQGIQGPAGSAANTGNITFDESTISNNQSQDIVIHPQDSGVKIVSGTIAQLQWGQDNLIDGGASLHSNNVYVNSSGIGISALSSTYNYTWLFKDNGKIQLPLGGDIVDHLGVSVLGANTFSTIAVSGQTNIVADSAADILTLASGSGIAITTNAATDTLTIASTVQAFKNIAITSGATLVADSDADTLTLTAGAGMQLTGNAATDTLTIASTITAFGFINVAGQTIIQANTPVDQLTFEAGSAITLTTIPASDTLRVAVSDNPTIPGTAAMRVPFGNTAARPGTGANGQLRFNTTTTALEVFNTSWKSLVDEVVSVGTGTNVIKAVTNSLVEVRSVKAGTGISITTDGNDITFSASLTDLTTASNVGTGTGVFKEKVGTELIFRSIKAGEGVTVTTDGNDITVSSPRDLYVESGTVTTTTAAFTDFVWTNTLAPVANSSWFFEATFIGRRTGGTVERNAFRLEGVVDNTAGTISLVGPAAKTTYQNNATQWDVDVSIVSNTLRFRAKGEASKNIKWTGWLRYQVVTET